MQPSSVNQYSEIKTVAAIAFLLILFFHFYITCWGAFRAWGLTLPIIDRVGTNLAHGRLLAGRNLPKILALSCMAFLLIGTQAAPAISWRKILIHLVTGMAFYFGSTIVLYFSGNLSLLAGAYIGCTLTGILFIYNGARELAGILAWQFQVDIFNRYNESFPQEERLLANQYSVNFRARYYFRNRVRDSWLNLPNIFRGVLVCGTPGSGKTRYIFRQVIQQNLEKGFSMFVFDLKYDDLTRIAYNTLQRVKHLYPVVPTFHAIVFDDLSLSERCNPILPSTMHDISDAAESSRTMLMALNREWIRRQGEFFVESAVSFVTANIWFLRMLDDGRYCTIPHLIELIQCDYNKLFSVLRSFKTTQTLISPFVSAFLSNSMDQLEGQVASARIALSTLASPDLYYVLSGNDFTLDINNPKAPKIVAMASNPQKQMVYGAVISLYVSRMVKQINRKGGTPCSLIFDEFPSLWVYGMDNVLAQARSNLIAAVIGIQDISQLRKEYGHAQAEALFNLPGNLISGQVSGDTARLISERFGKIQQQKTSHSTNSRDSSTTESQQLDLAVPASKIATLSSGEFVAIVADNPGRRMPLKGFYGDLVIDDAAIAREQAAYQRRPKVREVTPEIVDHQFNTIKEEVHNLVHSRLAYMAQTPNLARLIVNKLDNGSKMRQPHP
jgi:hypothetical protein